MLGSLAALPIVAAGTLVNAGVANAAALKGEFNFASWISTTAILSSGKVDFDDPGSDPVQAILTVQKGNFAALNAAFLKDIVPIGSNQPTNNPLFDLESQPVFPGFMNEAGDGKNIFNATRIGQYGFKQSGDNVAIDLGVWGDFISATGEKTRGAGNFTFQVNNAKADDIAKLIAKGGTIETSFSGAAFTSVPEPASILGLGVVAGSLAASRRRKASQPS